MNFAGNISINGIITFILNKSITNLISFSNMLRIEASDFQHAEEFGASVALSTNDLIIVGAPSEFTSNLNDTNSGAVYVYKNINNIWAEQFKIKATTPAVGGNFGFSVAVSNNNTTLVVGEVNGIGSGGTAVGAVYIYEEPNAQWNLVTPVRLIVTGISINARVGHSVTISGNGLLMATGAQLADPSGVTNAGSTYVYRKENGSWISEPRLAASDPQTNAIYGTSVKISSDGTILLVGAPGTENNIGSVYVYNRVGTSWVFSVKIIPSNNIGSLGDFGRTVDISDDNLTMVIAAPDDNSGIGAFYVYRKINNIWVETDKITKSGMVSGDRFGRSVSISPNGLIIAVGYRDFNNDMGATTIYTFNGVAWIEDSTFLPPVTDPDRLDDTFGTNVDTTNSLVLVGSPKASNSTNGLDPGAVFIVT